jgi:peptidyl-dipeptidase A
LKTKVLTTGKNEEKNCFINLNFLEQDINFLLFSALRNIAFAPFALAVEKWRWAVYAGETTPATYNIDWWRLRCKYQGIVPPVNRASDDFDAGSKYVSLIFK